MKFNNEKIGASQSQQLWKLQVGATPLASQPILSFVSGLPGAHGMPNHFVMACMSRKLIRKKEKELIDNLVHCVGVPGREVSGMLCQVPFYLALSLMIQKRGGNKEAVALGLQKSPIKGHPGSTHMENNGCGNEDKTLCWGLVGKNRPYSSGKQIKSHHS